MSYRCVSMPNMAAMCENSSAKSTDIGWRSTPNLKFNRTNDIRRPEPSKNCDSEGFLDGRFCVSEPNIPIHPKLAGETAADIGWRSTPNLKFQQVTSDVRKPKSSKNFDSKGFLDGRLCVSEPNIPIHPKLAGETAADIGWRSTPNLKFQQVTSDVRKLESSKNFDSKGFLDGRLCVSEPNIPVHPKLAGETAADIGWRSTPNLKFQQVTSDVRKPESPRHTRPRRSFWCQTKKFVRRFLCCCSSVDKIDQ